ncbi:putative GTP-binding protein [Halobacteriovorax marinus SJ]|uniref:GTPase Obg n=1 Tax=Halobacteriovorax marinus (strain ATCC BAA-682 / DSM 15412 / SJ) TaxID=862908 RepID=E1WYV5_HALMS|nr:GTPase ObgE [Halobacteriovorax marinus]CBW27746.1 putative GTP-binding protein [Halobacteriovorax marinus SJ]
MRFIDEVVITIISGNGGNGCASFRREKFYPLGGPDGGDGGDGGSVFIQADRGINTLVNFRSKRIFKAEHGQDGMNSQCHGRYGEDLTLNVPVGTIIRSAETGEIIGDLTEHGEKILMAEGGRGGMGNIHFKSSINQAPKHATFGKEGRTLEIELELKLIADIALIGLPNAGKSTLISTISAAKPKIADYPFTTLEPNLGVVTMGPEQSFVVADIPGLIEDASEGKGLGIKFLKHIERTKAFVHLVDVSWCLDEFEAFEQYVTIREELRKYNEDLLTKKELVCLTKIDAMTEEEIQKFIDFFEEQIDRKVLPLSAVSGRNIGLLKSLMLKTFEDYEE